MKIEVDLTDFAELEQRAIYIMAGVELVAKRIGGEWKVKTVHCDLCGKCCMNLDRSMGFPLTRKGTCKNLERRSGDKEEYLCALGGDRPFSCSVFVPDKDFCCIEF